MFICVCLFLFNYVYLCCFMFVTLCSFKFVCLFMFVNCPFRFKRTSINEHEHAHLLNEQTIRLWAHGLS
ncbi:hypothetical protein HanRHA438_Chr07g0319021 [Helianthus annuus]|nr:hypothetical protein HanRHA438_Chr07g0319021 [Helianthus annuus]